MVARVEKWSVLGPTTTDMLAYSRRRDAKMAIFHRAPTGFGQNRPRPSLKTALLFSGRSGRRKSSKGNNPSLRFAPSPTRFWIRTTINVNSCPGPRACCSLNDSGCGRHIGRLASTNKVSSIAKDVRLYSRPQRLRRGRLSNRFPMKQLLQQSHHPKDRVQNKTRRAKGLFGN